MRVKRFGFELACALIRNEGARPERQDIWKTVLDEACVTNSEPRVGHLLVFGLREIVPVCELLVFFEG